MKRIVLICIVLLIMFDPYFFEYCDSAELEKSIVNIDIKEPLIFIEQASYPSFDEIDLAKNGDELISNQDLAITIADYSNDETNLMIKYRWKMVNQAKSLGDKTSVSIGNGTIGQNTYEKELPFYNSVANTNIPENTFVELVNIKNQDCHIYEYRIPKEDITLNVDKVSTLDVGTYHIHQSIFLMYVQENN